MQEPDIVAELLAVLADPECCIAKAIKLLGRDQPALLLVDFAPSDVLARAAVYEAVFLCLTVDVAEYGEGEITCSGARVSSSSLV